tara:strand:+ start:7706 stop:7972 length:267 start_codon:yes stop_codon:yes gene_type:complete
VNEFRAHHTEIITLTFHPTKPVIASIGKQGEVRISNYETGELLKRIATLHQSANALAFNPSGTRLAIGSNSKGDLSVWELGDALKDVN